MFTGIRICRFCKKSFWAINCSQHYCSLKCRFWSKVETLHPDDCWEWTACKRKGYGHFRYKEDLVLAHRMVWILTYGPIPEGFCCLHNCDNPPCCNPSHLFLGTKSDNAIDMVNKGRQRGPIPQKLTVEQVKEIKHELAKGTLLRILAKKYGVVLETISRINTGTNWSHV